MSTANQIATAGGADAPAGDASKVSRAAEPLLSEAERERIRDAVSRAADAIPLTWPIRTFISRNPLMGFEHLPFEEAVSRAQELFGGEGYLPLEEYRTLYTQDRISRSDLLAALRATDPDLASLGSVQLGERALRPDDVLWHHLIHGLDPLDPRLLAWQLTEGQATKRIWRAVPEPARQRLRARAAERGGPVADAGVETTSRPATDSEASYVEALWSAVLGTLDLPSEEVRDGESAPLPRGTRTAAESIDRMARSELVQEINEQMIKWCAAFADEGMADWSMPLRPDGFYRAWRRLAARDASVPGTPRADWSRRLEALPDRPEDALAAGLHRLGIPEPQWVDYLRRHLAQLPGWAGYLRWRAANPDYPEQGRHAVDLVEYLAVRLFYEAELAERTCRRRLGLSGSLSEMLRGLESRNGGEPPAREAHGPDARTRRICRDGWRLFHLAQLLELDPEDLERASSREVLTLLAWLDRFPTRRLQHVWQSAYEGHYRESLLARLAGGTRGSASQSGARRRPRAQAAFCIDVRSEPFRRHLEAQGEYETIGFAGFFATPICYRPLEGTTDLLLCPVLIKPKYVVREAPRPEQPDLLGRHEVGERWHEAGHHLFHDLKASPVASYVTMDLLGALFGLAMIGKTVALEPYHRLRAWLRGRLAPPVPTRIPVDKPTESEGGETAVTSGFTRDEQVLVAENALRLMSLTKDFGRLVLFCGHGSTTENNPYASAYDCGACGGNHGGPNARVLAALCNKPHVRAELRARGIDIPEDTHFLPGEHDTTTDRVTLFDLEELPDTHREDVRQLQRDLEAAGLENARERCARLPGAPRDPAPAEAARHVRRRGRDWAQIRPEWGLSGNAAFIIARRALTRELALDGRTFLHNYDAPRDESGKVLETIMTAPLVVAQWINFQYFFSSMDPWAYGSGSKVLHNVVSGVGVMLGRHSDLQPGLPLQSVHDGPRRYHEPLRLLAIIEAGTDRISGIIARHAVLQQLFDNRWVHLVACDPETGAFSRYLPGGQWHGAPEPSGVSP